MLLVASPAQLCAQEDAGDAPLGDVARGFRKKSPSNETVIDNDNFSKVMDDAESHHAAGSSMVFSFDSGGKSFRVSSPDVTCSLSFTAKTSSLLADPLQVDELPRSELAKLDGPATIDGDSLQVSMHNGTSWELREVMIGLTIIRRQEGGEATGYYGPARIVPAVAGGSAQQAQDSFQKQPDVTLLLKVKGSAAPSATAIFRTSLNFALFPDQEWHWAIVRAKGIPPQPSGAAMATQPGQPSPLERGADRLSPEQPASPQNPAPTPLSAAPTSNPAFANSSSTNPSLMNPPPKNPTSPSPYLGPR